jgi:hypothetical protein
MPRWDLIVASEVWGDPNSWNITYCFMRRMSEICWFWSYACKISCWHWQIPIDLCIYLSSCRSICFFDVAHKCATILCEFKILQAPSGPTCPPAILEMWKKRKTSNSEWLMYPLIWLRLLLKCSKPSNPQIKHFVVLHFDAVRQTHYSHAVWGFPPVWRRLDE